MITFFILSRYRINSDTIEVLFEPYSSSLIKIEKILLHKLMILNLVEVRGLQLVERYGRKFVEDEWLIPEYASAKNDYTAVIVANDKVRLANSYVNNKTISINSAYKLDSSRNICNLSEKNGEIRFEGALALELTNEKANEVGNRYLKFIAKSKLIGSKINFGANILGEYVVLNSNKCNTREYIIPEFIDVIETEVFQDSFLKQVKFNEGLKIIGSNAFMNCNLNKVDIPSTVKLVCPLAFSENVEVNTSDNTLMLFKDSYYNYPYNFVSKAMLGKEAIISK